MQDLTNCDKENSTKNCSQIKNVQEPNKEASEFSFSPRPSLEEIRLDVENFVNERNWQQFHTPRNILLGNVCSYCKYLPVDFHCLFV